MGRTALVFYPYLKSNTANRIPEAVLAEAVSLTKAINLTVPYAESIALNAIQAPTFLGKGTVARLADVVAEYQVDVVIMACHLSPLQQRNLEKELNTKVIDKTALILEIFGERARTKEGALQVELAHLTYQRSRLVRSWTHLERQRGGAGFLGGPGERQIELDRRQIDTQIIHIKKELEQVKKTRTLHRQARKRVPYPIVALVGYTNAGKSTLFNLLTAADVMAKDLLFATLDPTMRRLKLPSGQPVILSDTVGFISELPTELVMAFRATLEEVLEADLILHVRDCSHPDTNAQKQDVENVLRGLGLSHQVDMGLIEVLNKTDLLEPDEENRIYTIKTRQPNEWPVSAKTGRGIQDLLTCIEQKLSEKNKVIAVSVPVEAGDILARLYRCGQVLARTDTETHIIIKASVPPKDESFFAPFRTEEQ